MLRPNQTQLTQPRLGGHAPIQDEPGLTELVSLAFGFLRRQYLIILSIAFLSSSAGVLYLHFATPIYTAHAKIVTEVQKGKFFRGQNVLADTQVDSAQLANQLLILKSESIAKAVIDDLHLLDYPEFARPSTATLSKTELMREAFDIFEKKLDVSRIGGSYVIDIAFDSQNAKLAAQIANSVAEHYISEEQDAQLKINQRVGNWLQARLEGLREQVSIADSAVVQFAKEHNIVSTDGKLMDDQQLVGVNSQLVAARSRTAEALARLFRIQAVVRQYSTNEPTTDATVSDALKNPIISNLRQKYLELENRAADWTARFGANHQAVIHLRDQQREIRNSIHAELERLAESYKSDYAIARQREDEAQRALGTAVSQLHLTNKEEIKLRELKASAKSYHTLYETFLRQYTQTVEQQSFPIPELRVISHAHTPSSKSHPKSKVILAISILGGIALGLGIGMLRELTDRVFRTSDQIEATLNTPCTAVLPLLAETPRVKFSANRKAIISQFGPRTIIRDSSLYWTLVDSPESRFAEGIRSIKLAMDVGNADRANKVIGFTSSLPNEGKSTVVTAVAQLIGQVGSKVIVVDCDLRNPCLSRALTKNSEHGIVEVMSGRRSLEDVVWRELTTNFTFLPVGNNVKFSHTSQILASDLTKKLFDNLRQRYDYVIVDLPPLAPIVDVRATSKFIDSYFMVVEWGETKVDVVQHALSSADTVYDNLNGVILNKTDMNSLTRYDIHRDKYYFNKYYKRYGYTQGA
jgi:succinoglycan biosynthesis transport protein ExoP